MLATPGPMAEQPAELASIAAGGPHVPAGAAQAQATQTGGWSARPA
jgi:hypothetical protein